MSNDGLSTNEKVNLLFKNFMNFTSTLDSKQFYEETAFANNTNIFSDNILSSLPPISPSYDSVTEITTISSLLENGISDISINDTWYNDKTKNSSNQSIGTFQKEASNVILRMEKIKLDYVNNGGAAFVCIDNNGTNILQNIIPSNYASSGYSISLEYEKTSGVLKPIGWLATRSQLAANAYVGSSVDFGGALFDAKNGIITFYDVNGDPATVFGSAKFYFTATKYVGSKGAGSSGVLGDSVNVLETTTATHTADISSINGTVSDLSANVYDMSSNFGTRAISAVSDATDIVLGGTPTAPTATSSTDNTTQIATTEFVQSAISSSSQWTTVNTDDVTYTSGNVGIGITNPSYKLDVSGTSQFRDNVDVNGITFHNEGYSASSPIYYHSLSTGSLPTGWTKSANASVLSNSLRLYGSTIITTDVINLSEHVFFTDDVASGNNTYITTSSRILLKVMGKSYKQDTASEKMRIELLDSTDNSIIDVIYREYTRVQNDLHDFNPIICDLKPYIKHGRSSFKINFVQPVINGGFEDYFEFKQFTICKDDSSPWYKNSVYKQQILGGLSIGTGDYIGRNLSSQELLVEGNVGIGTTNPSEKLDVVGNINFSGDLYKNGAVYNQWTTVNTNDITYTNTSGNVGIGMTNPAVKLDITSMYTCSGDDHTPAINTLTSNIFSNTLGESFTWITLQNNTHGSTPLEGMNNNELFDQLSINAINYNEGGSGQLGVYDRVKTGIGFSTRNLHNVNENALAIDYRGYVGIGITTPSVALDVSGNIKATNIEGTLTTAAQPAITSVGTLTGLTVTNPIAGSVTGSAATVTTAAQPVITSVGTLTGLTVTNPIAGSVTGSAATVTTAAQPVITSVGTLSDLTISATNDVTITTASTKNILLQPGGASDGNEKVHIKGDLTVDGSINFTGGFVQTNTNVQITDQLDISNNGTGPALIARQHGTADVAAFYDDSAIAMVIKNDGNVGIGTDSPSQALDVNGSARIANKLYATDLSAQTLSIHGDSSFNTDVRIMGNLILDGSFNGAGSAPKLTISTRTGTTNNIDFTDISAIRFDTDSGFAIDDLSNGEVKIKMNSTYKTWKVDGQTDLVAEGLDTMNFASDKHIDITTSTAGGNKTITFGVNHLDASFSEVQTTLDGKQDTLTFNAPSTNNANPSTSAQIKTALDLKANLASPTFTGTVAGITKAMVGLTNVDDTTDAGKPISDLTVTALAAKANLASPTFTGIPIAPTASSSNSTTQLATTEFVQSRVTEIIGAAPAALDTLNELAAALGDDADFSGTVTNSLSLKAPLASPTFTGTVAGITKAMVGLTNVDDTTDAGKPVSTAQQTALNLKANLASPTFTGIPIAPTASSSNSTTQLATTEFVQSRVTEIIGAAPAALDTLNELAAALGDDADFSGTVTNSLSLKAPLASPTFTGTVGGITKAMVGLTNVDDTTDAGKPISDLTVTALAAKANLASPTFTGTVAGITQAMVGLTNVDNTTDAGKPISDLTVTALAAKANLAGPTFTGNVGIGSATPSVALDVVGAINATGNVNASNIGGTLTTVSQPNITTVGTLNSGAISNGFGSITSGGAITGTSLSAGSETGEITGKLVSANQSNITTVGTLSDLTISATNDVTITTASNKNILLQPGGTGDGPEKVHIKGSLTVDGSINFTGGFVQTNTNVQITDQLDISNNGTGPALIARQHGTADVAAFYDDSAIAMVIKNDGNVGIGITNPSYKLDVVGTMAVSGATTISNTLNVTSDVSFGTNLTVNDAYIGSGAYISQGYATFSHNSHKADGANYAVLQDSDGRTIINSSSTKQIEFRNASNSTATNTMVFKGGKLGIGRTPTQALDVNGNIRISKSGGDGTQGGLLVFDDTYNKPGPNKIRLHSGGYGFGVDGAMFKHIAGGIAHKWYYGASTSSNGTRGMHLESGSLGIGTDANTSYGLDVNGHINFSGDLYKNGAVYNPGSQWTTVNTNDITYTNTSGNVGIGMTNPAVKLDITSMYTCSGDDHTPAINTLTSNIFSNIVGESFTWITLQNKTHSSTPLEGMNNNELFDQLSINAINYNSGGSGQFGVNDRVKTGIGFSTRNLHNVNENALAIDYRGYVGIGTTTPSVALDVIGNIKATNIEGTLTTAAQPVITSVGTLNNLDVNATTDVTITTADSKNILLQPGGTGDGPEKVHIKGSLTVDGSINFTGGFVQTNTNVQITDQLDISNNGTGPALIARQHGANNIADFYDDTALAMRIANGGNVGIGTDSPAQKLDVNGNIFINTGGTGSGQGGLLICDAKHSVAGPNKIRLLSTTTGYGFGVDGDTLKYLSPKYHKFYTVSTNSTNGNLALEILDDKDVKMYGGAVINGDVSMNSGASILGGAYITGDIGNMNTAKTPPGVYLGTLSSGGSQYAMMQMVSNNGIGGWIDWTDNTGNSDFEGRIRYSRTDSTGNHKAGFNFYTDETHRMVIDTTGNVGIGITSATEKLEVNGNIRINNGKTTLDEQGGTLLFDNAFNKAGPNKIVVHSAGYGFGVDQYTLKYNSNMEHKFYVGSGAAANGNLALQILANTDVSMNGAVINGDVSMNGAKITSGGAITGTSLSAGSETGEITGKLTAASANQSNITTVGTLSDLTISATNDVTITTASNKNILLQPGGTGDGPEKVHIKGSLTVDGSINFTGGFIQTNTNVQITDQLDISNNGTGPALIARQHGTNNIADFYDDNTLAMRIANGGNVGIGITNPSQKLDVSGNIKATNIEGTLTTVAQTAITSVGLLTQLEVVNDSSFNADLYVAGNLTVTDIITTGNVGMNGDVSMNSGAYIAGASKMHGGAYITGDFTNMDNTQTSGIYLGVKSSNNAMMQMVSNTNNTGWIDWTSTTSSDSDYEGRIGYSLADSANNHKAGFNFYTNSLHRMNIDHTTGNVGIGMTNPAVTLDINSPDTFGTSTHKPAINTLTGNKFSNTADDSFTWITLQNKANDTYPLSGFSANELFDQLSINAINYYNSSSGTGQYGYNGRVKTGMGFSTRNNTTVNENALAIDYRGYVGIGDTTPSFALDVNGTFRVQADGNDLIRVVKLYGSRSHIVMGSNIQVTGSPLRYTYNPSDTTTSWNSSLREIRTSSEADDITLNVGRIIGGNTVTPDFLWAGMLNFNGADGSRSIATMIINIFCDESIAAAGAFLVYSDKRIKKDILTVDDDKALVDFRKLNPCTYSYIDTIGRGNKNVYGFIAQEVKEVLPHSCSTRTETVPNVYSIADISGNFLILQGGTFDNLEHDLTDSSGNVYENISIAIEGVNREKIYYYIKDIVNSTTIELYEELPSSLYIYNETTGNNQCFVFGQFVNNFNMLDKNAIWTVAAAATQEIDRQQQADKVRIAELETKVETLETQLVNVLARLTALESA
jgi:hypothetical protein